MKKKPIALVTGLIVVAVTVIAYFAILSNVVLEAIHFITLAGVVVAELITTAYASTTKGGPRKVAAAGFSALMIPVAVILSVVYIVSFPEGYTSYILWYLVATLVINAISLILLMFNSAKEGENARLQQAKGNVTGMRKQIACILVDPAAEPYKAQLKAIDEKLHYGNDWAVSVEDENIRGLLSQLQDQLSDAQAAEELLKKLELAVERRSIMMSRTV